MFRINNLGKVMTVANTRAVRLFLIDNFVKNEHSELETTTIYDLWKNYGRTSGKFVEFDDITIQLLFRCIKSYVPGYKTSQVRVSKGESKKAKTNQIRLFKGLRLRTPSEIESNVFDSFELEYTKKKVIKPSDHAENVSYQSWQDERFSRPPNGKPVLAVGRGTGEKELFQFVAICDNGLWRSFDPGFEMEVYFWQFLPAIPSHEIDFDGKVLRKGA